MANYRNIKLILAYDGTAYAGWQRQKKATTIQGVLEEKLQIITGSATRLHGASRTDAGVHALGMAAHFKTTATLPLDGLRKGLNSLLPDDIKVRKTVKVDYDFHARYNTLGKMYFYNITTEDILLPTERLYQVQIKNPFDPKPVQNCLQLLLGQHDFSSFEAVGSRDITYTNGKGAVREIFTAKLVIDPNMKKIQFFLAGDGFLRHMIRNIVGTLVKVGQGKLSTGDFKVILISRNRATAGATMPAHGLFLKEVYY